MSSFMDAYKIMEEFGMHKGSTYGPNGSVCAIGACMVAEVRSGDILDKIAAEQFPDRLKLTSSLRNIAQLNDHPDTTLDDIRVVFEKADLRRQEL